MELENDNFGAAEQIFGKSLLTVPNVQLWSTYLNYIRRMNDLTNDATGNARTTVSQAYDFVLANIGVDRDSGKIWQEYIQFIRSIPGQIGGSSWQDQQKMDTLRKAYQRAICVPMSTVSSLWKEYDQFEMGLNKMTVSRTVVYLPMGLIYLGSQIHTRTIPRLHDSQKRQYDVGESHTRTHQDDLTEACTSARV